MKYIFWDIDGTLLLTGLAGADALRAAIRELLALKISSFRIRWQAQRIRRLSSKFALI